jgi:hypothetical protein
MWSLRRPLQIGLPAKRSSQLLEQERTGQDFTRREITGLGELVGGVRSGVDFPPPSSLRWLQASSSLAGFTACLGCETPLACSSLSEFALQNT